MNSSSFLLLILTGIFLSGISSVDSQTVFCNNNGVVDPGEECDMGNDTTACINCNFAVQLDLGFGTVEYFDLDTVIYFTESAELSLVLSPSRNLTRIFLVMIEDMPPVDDEINIFPTEAFSAGLIDMDYSPFFTKNFLAPADPRLAGFNINMSLVTRGMLITASTDSVFFGGDGDNEFTQEEAEIALLSAGYRAREHPGFNPRQFCVIVEDSVTSSTSCQVLAFIGRNDDPPMVSYDGMDVASFTEGQVDFIPIINGTISISDPDHPRYLQMAATASITDYIQGNLEVISVLNFHPDFLYEYDSLTGVLTINGSGTPEVYETLLNDLTYHNNMTEPLDSSREIQIAIFDGIFWSSPASVLIDIINVNDPPEISLDGADPIVDSLSANYIEGSGSVQIAPNLVVIDVDPGAMIQRVTVRIMNPIDGAQERLNHSSADNMGVAITLTPHEVVFTGTYPISVYSSVVRGVTYEHLDATPGNPSTDEVRVIEFEVDDANGATNLQNSLLMLTIVPVDDAPILLFVYQRDSSLFSGSGGSGNSEPLIINGNTTAVFMYTEDDAAVNIGRDIYLRDVDSNIGSATLWLTNLLNGMNDDVYISSVLLTTYNVTMTTEVGDVGMSRVITLNGEALPEAYEEILQSLTYRNLHQDNQLSDGQRAILITVNDTTTLTSQQINITIDVADRNDAPSVDIGGGANANLNINFTENGASIPIVLPHLLSIMDEEGHNISRLTVELVAPSADTNLDPTDAIFLRSPQAIQFIENLLTPPTVTRIDIGLNATTATYREALLSFFYDNAEDEPTLFRREVVITLYDNNFLPNGITSDPNSNFDDDLGVSRTVLRVGIEIIPVNDNAPRILIRAQPDGCGLSSGVAGGDGPMRRRRDVKVEASKMRKRSVQYKVDDSKSPGIANISAHLTSSKCIRTINITFNTDTNTPIVEIPSKLKNIISFDNSVLNAAHKFGRWLDRSTLLIVFSDECLEWKKVGINGRERAVFVFFEAERGDCTWETSCSASNAICFHNNTGCSISGPYQIDVNSSPCQAGMVNCDDVMDPTEDTEEEEGHSGFVFYVLLVIVMTAILLTFSYICKRVVHTSRTIPDTTKVQIQSTSIQMTPDPIVTSDPTKELPQDMAGVQEVAVTISPLPSYEEKVGVVKYPRGPGMGKQTPTPHGRARERKRRRRKMETENKADVKQSEEALLLSHDESSTDDDDENGGVITLSSAERSCDALSSSCSSPPTATNTQSYLSGSTTQVSGQNKDRIQRSKQLSTSSSSSSSSSTSSPSTSTEQSLSLHSEQKSTGSMHGRVREIPAPSSSLLQGRKDLEEKLIAQH